MPSEFRLDANLRVAGEHRPRLDLELRLRTGITLMVGPSGAGKSTCLLALAGLLRPQQGRIELDGETMFDADRGLFVPSHRRRVALVFQSLALFPHLTVEQNVLFGVARSLARARRRELAADWLARMRIPQLASRRPATLSGGEAQRVALARALASAPRLLLLDEPFSALDAGLRTELAAELNEVVASADIPALIVTHQPRDPFRASETVELREGRRVA